MAGLVLRRPRVQVPPPPPPPPSTPVAGFVLGSEPKFKFTIKHVNSQLVYIGPVGLIINLVVFI